MTSEILSYIVWNPDPVIFRIGDFGLRWYSSLWCLGLVAGYFIVRWLYRREGMKSELFEPLFLYCFTGVLIGGRLGHCLFYQPDYFLASWDHIVEMFLPIRKGMDGWHFTGYEGLASHGGVFGMLIAYWIYTRRYHVSIWFVLDCVGIAAPFTACCIRLGNLMNSEIIGRVTDVPWAFIFEHVDHVPRHPGQLYEALFYLLVGIVGLALYFSVCKRKVGTGFFFGYCIGVIFTFRFFIEFLKEVQEDFEEGLLLDMGQLLSLPLIVLGIACMIGGKWMEKYK